MFYMSFIYFKPSPSIESKCADIQYRRYRRRNSEISFSFEVYFSLFQEFIFTTIIGHVLKQPIAKTITQIHFLRELCHDVFHLCTHLVSKLGEMMIRMHYWLHRLASTGSNFDQYKQFGLYEDSDCKHNLIYKYCMTSIRT